MFTKKTEDTHGSKRADNRVFGRGQSARKDNDEEDEGDAQLIAHKGEGGDESDANDEAHDLGHKGVEAGHDEETSEYGGTNVTRCKDCWGMTAGHDGCTAGVRIYGDLHDGPSGQDGLRTFVWGQGKMRGTVNAHHGYVAELMPSNCEELEGCDDHSSSWDDPCREDDDGVDDNLCGE